MAAIEQLRSDKEVNMKPVARHLAQLSCPECRGKFTFTEHPTDSLRDGEFGVLECGCFAYPVLDSVPIVLRESVAQFSFGTGDVESEGPRVSAVIDLIRQGKGVDALVECLTFTPFIELLDRLPGWRLWHEGLVPKITHRWVKKDVRRLVQNIDSASAEDWLELYFTRHAGANRVLLEYYRHRFILPRTLATYSLLELLAGNTTILDIACGLGPFGHFLSRRSSSSKVIGFDFNFYLAWWQRRFMAPDQLFLCADGNCNLPFQDDTFDAIYCSDSFVYIPDSERLLEECQRCAPDKPLVITRIGNGDVYPKGWGNELDAKGYEKLFGENTRIFREIDLVRSYLDRKNPLQQKFDPASELGHDKWLHVITNATDAMRDTALEGLAPHAVGNPVINPIFSQKKLEHGRLRFDFSFPSVYFAYQNADMFGYHGDKTTCDAQILADIGENINDPKLTDLVDKFIVIGLPPKYLRP